MLKTGVHHRSPGGDRRPKLLAVHRLRGPAAGVPGPASDLLDRHAGLRQQGHERVAQLARRPVLAKTGVRSDHLELAPDTSWGPLQMLIASLERLGYMVTKVGIGDDWDLWLSTGW